MRLLLMPMRCCHIAVGGYSGTPLSLSSTKRWLRGSFSASRSISRSAMLLLGLPQAVCSIRRMRMSLLLVRTADRKLPEVVHLLKFSKSRQDMDLPCITCRPAGHHLCHRHPPFDPIRNFKLD